MTVLSVQVCLTALHFYCICCIALLHASNYIEEWIFIACVYTLSNLLSTTAGKTNAVLSGSLRPQSDGFLTGPFQSSALR